MFVDGYLSSTVIVGHVDVPKVVVPVTFKPPMVAPSAPKLRHVKSPITLSV